MNDVVIDGIHRPIIYGIGNIEDSATELNTSLVDMLQCARVFTLQCGNVMFNSEKHNTMFSDINVHVCACQV